MSTHDIAATLPDCWQEALAAEFTAPYWQSLQAFIAAREAAGAQVYPPPELRLRALQVCPLAQVKVVLLGQDPYHGPGQAHGLSFSVPAGTKIPPSLRNIFKKLVNHDELLSAAPDSGELTGWADQGVLLLNAVLTVEDGQAGSHAKQGWEQFTDAIIRIVAKQTQPCVFLLWGNYARKKAAMIQPPHLVLESAHPSPLSARHGFFTSDHFRAANSFLAEQGRATIAWERTV